MPTHVPPAIAGLFSAMTRRLCPLALGALLIGLAAPESLAQDGRQTGARPDSLALSADSLQASLDREVAEQTAAAEGDVVREAFDAVFETERALRALADEDTEEALAALERAVGKLEVLLARRPGLGLVPLDVAAEVRELRADPATVESLVAEAEDLIEDGHVQAARRVLDGLASELEVTTVSLPLATYPAAIREAARLIEAGDTAAARQFLLGALSTLLVEKEATPIPLIYAEAMVGVAADVAPDDPDLALDLLADARDQLRLAEALGYGDRDREFAGLDEAIVRLAVQVEERADTTGAFDRLGDRLGRFKDRISE